MVYDIESSLTAFGWTAPILKRTACGYQRLSSWSTPAVVGDSASDHIDVHLATEPNLQVVSLTTRSLFKHSARGLLAALSAIITDIAPRFDHSLKKIMATKIGNKFMQSTKSS